MKKEITKNEEVVKADVEADVDNKKIIKVIRKNLKKKDGTPFVAFKLVESSGKLIDLYFLSEVDLTKFENMFKFYVQVGYCVINHNYEYPKAFVSKVDYDTISKIV